MLRSPYNGGRGRLIYMTDCLHVWVPAGLEHDDPRVCARCNAEQPSTLQG